MGKIYKLGGGSAVRGVRSEEENLRRGHRGRRVRREEKSGGGIHRTKNVRWKTVPRLRGPTRQKTARKKKSSRSARDDRAKQGPEKRDGNTEFTEIGTQRTQRREERRRGSQDAVMVPRSLHCTARRAGMQRGRIKLGRSGPFDFAQGRRDDNCRRRRLGVRRGSQRRKKEGR